MGVIRSLVICILNGSMVCRITISSPHWLRFDLFFDRYILPNQRGFFNLLARKIGIRSGIMVDCVVINLKLLFYLLENLSYLSLERPFKGPKRFPLNCQARTILASFQIRQKSCHKTKKYRVSPIHHLVKLERGMPLKRSPDHSC